MDSCISNNNASTCCVFNCKSGFTILSSDTPNLSFRRKKAEKMNISRFIKFMLQWGSKSGTQSSKEDYIPARDKWSPFSIFTSGTWKLSTNKSSNRSKATASCTSNPSRNADTKSAPFWSELALVVCGDVLSSTDLVRVLNRTCSLRNSTNGVSILSQFSLNGVSLLYLVPETSEIASAATAGNWEGLKSSFESIIWRGYAKRIKRVSGGVGER